MKLAENGVAYFLEEYEDFEDDEEKVNDINQNPLEKELDCLLSSKYGLELETDLALTGPGSLEKENETQTTQKPKNQETSTSITSLDEETKSILITSPEIEKENSNSTKKNPQTKYRHVLNLSSSILKSLNLQPYLNTLSFSITTAYQGTTTVTSKLFLWKSTERVVISDIDGTITRSDLLGHVLPRLGHPWAQVGVTQLFTDIAKNGYQFLYLSARAVGQARRTRAYLGALKQEEVGLPEGPVLLSPTSVFFALHR